jgi:hypothetical protein
MAEKKKYHEAEFGVWVEEPDALTKPSCDALWNGEWDHRNGPRPRCFRPVDHPGEHHETRPLSDEPGWVEFYWDEDPSRARTELRKQPPPTGEAGPEGGGPRGVDEPA